MTHSTRPPAPHGQEAGVQVMRPHPSNPGEPAGPGGFRAPEPLFTRLCPETGTVPALLSRGLTQVCTNL